MDQYFILSYGSEFSKKRELHFVAPSSTTWEEFNHLCRDLAKKAAKKLTESHRFVKKLISWSDIIDEVAEMLTIDYGYQLVYPKRCEFRGKSDLIHAYYPRNEADKYLGDVLSEVLDHNDTTTWDCHHQAVS